MTRHRVLVLHDSSGPFPQPRLKLLESAVSRDGYKAPTFQIRSYRIGINLSLLIVFAALASICTFLYIKVDHKVGIVTGLVSGISFISIAILLKYTMEQIILNKCVNIANTCAAEFRPNLILAQGYGAKIAIKMGKPRVPMILMSPILYELWAPKLCLVTAKFTEIPFTLILHGFKDSSNPIVNSVRLSNRFDRNRVRLEVLECDHHFTNITADSLRIWIEEAYDRGKTIVEELDNSGCKFVDKTLFSYDV